MHPRCLEETVRIVGLKGLSVFVNHENRAWCFSKLLHIVAHANHTTGQCWCTFLQYQRSFFVGSRAHHNALLTWNGSYAIVAVPLKLSAPKSAKIAINLSVIVFEYRWVDTERAADGLWFRHKRSFGTISHCHTKMEHAIIIFCREYQIVFAILLYPVVVPHLLLCPCHLLYIEHYAMVSSLIVFHIVER